MDSEFGKCLEDAVGPAAASVVTEALEGPASVSVRLNPFKWNADAEAAGRHFSCGASSVQWSGHGFLLDTRPSFTLDPYLHAGAYYVQDSSAMFVGELFRHCMAEMEGLVARMPIHQKTAPGQSLSGGGLRIHRAARTSV